MKAIPYAFCRDEQVAIDGQILCVGPAATLRGMREARRHAGQALSPQELDLDSFLDVLSRLYQTEQEDSAPDEDLGPVFALEDSGDVTGPRDLLEETTDAPVIQLVNQLFRKAIRSEASDLHVESQEKGLRARIRVDGTLRIIVDRQDIPAKRVISRLKVMANLDIAETRTPQDGRISLRLGMKSIDVRVSTMPGHFGERVVMRLLDRTSGLLPLAELGLNAEQENILTRLAAKPNGIILATGPTGSGKTTTLYSLLQLSDRERRNIVTVEDPIEYDLPGISQSQINADIGMTFASALRATLRQDPDVILVGEIRDGETASIATQAALTGHLVFSSIHANSSVGAIIRLRDLGVDDFMIASTLRGVIAQRLLRRLCPECSQPVAADTTNDVMFRKHRMDIPPQLFQAVGCAQCDWTGYDGRVGVFEIIEISEALRIAIDEGQGEHQLAHEGLSAQQTLLGQGLAVAARGETSLDEVQRVLGDIS